MAGHSYFFLLLGPSEVGKSTLIKRVVSDFPEIEYYPSNTTRSPRPGEEDGKDYFFITQEEVEKKIANGFFLEIDRPHNSYYYGIAKEPLLTGLLEGRSFIKETAINALNEFQKSSLSNSIKSFFLKPMEEEDIKNRLLERNANDYEDRLLSVEKEMKYEQSCDHIIPIKHKDIDFGYNYLVKLLLKYLRKSP